MSDNGDIKKDESSEQPQAIEMRIIIERDKPMVVHFPFLNDKVLTYGFLKVAEKTLDAHYDQSGKPKIIPNPGGIMNFARRMK